MMDGDTSTMNHIYDGRKTPRYQTIGGAVSTSMRQANGTNLPVYQLGNGTRTSVSQSGHGNTSPILYQFGDGTKMSVPQTGKGRKSPVYQFGGGNKTSVSQTTNNDTNTSMYQFSDGTTTPLYQNGDSIKKPSYHTSDTKTSSYQKVDTNMVARQDGDDGLIISNNVTKVLEECVRAMVDQLPPSRVQKNKGKVKRPMNSFMVFSQTARKAMAKVYPNLSYRKLSKALGRNWAVMGVEEKRPFIREAERLRQKHKQENPNYKFKPGKTRQLPGNFAKQYYGSHTTSQTKYNTPQTQNQLGRDFCYNIPTTQRLNSFGESPTLDIQYPYGSNVGFSQSSNNFGSRDWFYEEDPTPFVGHDILNGAQDIFERDNTSNSAVKYTISQPQLAPNNTTTSRNKDHHFTGLRPINYKGIETSTAPQADHFSANSPRYTPECIASFPTDLVSFCNFITT